MRILTQDSSSLLSLSIKYPCFLSKRKIDYSVSVLTSIVSTISQKKIVTHFCSFLTFETFLTKLISVKIKELDLVFSSFSFSFYFQVIFIFLFLETLGLGLEVISHTVTSVTSDGVVTTLIMRLGRME